MSSDVNEFLTRYVCIDFIMKDVYVTKSHIKLKVLNNKNSKKKLYYVGVNCKQQKELGCMFSVI